MPTLTIRELQHKYESLNNNKQIHRSYFADQGIFLARLAQQELKDIFEVFTGTLDLLNINLQSNVSTDQEILKNLDDIVRYLNGLYNFENFSALSKHDNYIGKYEGRKFMDADTLKLLIDTSEKLLKNQEVVNFLKSTNDTDRGLYNLSQNLLKMREMQITDEFDTATQSDLAKKSPNMHLQRLNTRDVSKSSFLPPIKTKKVQQGDDKSFASRLRNVVKSVSNNSEKPFYSEIVLPQKEHKKSSHPNKK